MGEKGRGIFFICIKEMLEILSELSVLSHTPDGVEPRFMQT